MVLEIIDNRLSIVVQANIYNIDVLHKCFYWYGAEFSVDIEAKSEALILITLVPNNRTDNIDFVSLSKKVKQDLIDFKLRDIITKETQTIRELLTAKAFAYYDQTVDPTTDISDPVGFNPVSI